MPAARETLLEPPTRRSGAQPWTGVRMVDVAAAAGVSRQTLYNEFGSKEGLGAALVRPAGRGIPGRGRREPRRRRDAGCRPRGLLRGRRRLDAARGPRGADRARRAHRMLGRAAAAAPPPGAGPPPAPGAAPRRTPGAFAAAERVALVRAARGARAGRPRRAGSGSWSGPARCGVRVALSYVVAPRRTTGRPAAELVRGALRALGRRVSVDARAGAPTAQWAVPESWRPMTPRMTSEIETSFSVETTSPRRTMP